MRNNVLVVVVLLIFTALAGCVPGSDQQVRGKARAGQGPDKREPDVIFIATPMPVVEAMLEIGGVRDGDVLYDLGSGDGRIPIEAAKRFDLRSVGIEIDPQLIRLARQNAERAGVKGSVLFRQEDLFDADFSDATVVMIYLFPEVNERLMPRLLAQLKPGSRIVSHDYLIGDWPPEKSLTVGDSRVFQWTVPPRDGPPR